MTDIDQEELGKLLWNMVDQPRSAIRADDCHDYNLFGSAKRLCVFLGCPESSRRPASKPSRGDKVEQAWAAANAAPAVTHATLPRRGPTPPRNPTQPAPH